MKVVSLLYVLCIVRLCTCGWVNSLCNACSCITNNCENGEEGVEEATDEYLFIDYTKENGDGSKLELEKRNATEKPTLCSPQEYTPGEEEGITLDLSNVNQDKIDVHKHYEECADNHTYYPKVSFFTMVRDGNFIIVPYKSSLCSMAQVYSNKKATLLSIFAQVDKGYKPMYFEKSGDKWGAITGEEFYEKSDIMNVQDMEECKNTDSLNQNEKLMSGYLRG
ncbi:signal peptide containing protein [Theileria equi strain WA]|uniref:Signal peptide containing protein n=1 Tax=Theileria equi strain WA TaxID=1537102 RepID=L1LC27_THEEQ|nr:signal peptide containing protein [Theileria equi strain WA]EKX73002.1 signal peptide containing protein [Theileria equi strain WA]|eukprot:XP_004832454.1 signal peptide containing protein [Theileria equi strain WA]